MSKPQSIMRMQIHYYDEAKSSDTVVCGQWEYLQAQRKFDGKTLKQAGEEGDLEYMSFIAYRAAVRQGLAAEGVSFDEWSKTIAAIEQDEETKGDSDAAGESPAPLDA